MFHPSPHQTVKHCCEQEAQGGGPEQLHPEVGKVIAEAVAGGAAPGVCPEAAGRVHEASEHDLTGDEGYEGEADLLHCHAQGLVSLVDTPDVDQEVSDPPEPQEEVEKELSDEEGHEWIVAIGLTITRDHRVW